MSKTLDCMIVGAQKCGTTSLKEYLSAHPDVVTHPQREFPAFRGHQHSERRQEEELGRLLSAAGDRLSLAKQAEMYSEPRALDRLSAVSPDCKLILMLRDPVARARSSFRMYALRSETNGSFGEMAARAIEADREGRRDRDASLFLHMGLYGKWLGEVLRRFPGDSVKVIFLEELRDGSTATYEDLCRWLGLDQGFSPDLDTPHNVGADPRSAALARAIKGLRSERNPLKRVVRGILPEAAYRRLAERMRDANRADRGEGSGARQSDENDSEEIDERLREYFQRDGDELSRLLSRELPWRAARTPPSG